MITRSNFKQECSRMRTARSLPYMGVSVLGGVSVQKGLCQGDRMWTETPQKEHGTRDPLCKEYGTRDRDPLWKEYGTRDRDPPERTWDQAARQEVTSYRDPLPP